MIDIDFVKQKVNSKEFTKNKDIKNYLNRKGNRIYKNAFVISFKKDNDIHFEKQRSVLDNEIETVFGIMTIREALPTFKVSLARFYSIMKKCEQQRADYNPILKSLFDQKADRFIQKDKLNKLASIVLNEVNNNDNI